MREHGTRAKYVIEKCRCEPCTDANRRYARERDRHERRVKYGLEAPRAKFVDAGEAREHLLWLRSIGIGRRTVAKRTGLSHSAIVQIATGETKRVLRDTADRILAVGRTAQPPKTLVDAAPTWTLIDDLRYLGFSKRRIALELGYRHGAIQFKRDRITLENMHRVNEVYERLLRETADWHGTTTGYKKIGCRCLRCKAAEREYRNARRQQLTDLELTGGGD